MSLSNDLNTVNAFHMFHDTALGGRFGLAVGDSAGSNKILKFYNYPAVSGAWVHWEVSFSSVTGKYYMFINGVKVKSGTVASFTRGATADSLGFGTTNGISNANHFMIDEATVWDTIQHTSNFTPPTRQALDVYVQTDHQQLDVYATSEYAPEYTGGAVTSERRSRDRFRNWRRRCDR
jgi:hypothetical protein